MAQVCSLLPTSVIHTTHAATAPLTPLTQEKRLMTQIHDMTRLDPLRRSASIRRIHQEQEAQRSTYYPDYVTIDT